MQSTKTIQNVSMSLSSSPPFVSMARTLRRMPTSSTSTADARSLNLDAAEPGGCTQKTGDAPGSPHLGWCASAPTSAPACRESCDWYLPQSSRPGWSSHRARPGTTFATKAGAEPAFVQRPLGAQARSALSQAQVTSPPPSAPPRLPSGSSSAQSCAATQG